MAAALHRFVKKPHLFRLINSIKLTQPLASHTNHIEKSLPTTSFFENRNIVNPNPEALDSFSAFINPIFPLGVHLNSISSIGLETLLEDGESGCGEEEKVIQADSVKKKRKKKMNKHKYRKLRKRLRRKT